MHIGWLKHMGWINGRMVLRKGRDMIVESNPKQIRIAIS
jgi:hypothetical protein